MAGAPCTKSTNKRMAVFVFPCTGGEGATTLGFLSHPLHLTQGRGRAQTHAELHIYVEVACHWNNKSVGLCLSPTPTPCPPCQAGDSWHAWRSPPGCAFTNALSQHLPPTGAALVPRCARLPASTPQLLCNPTEVHR